MSVTVRKGYFTRVKNSFLGVIFGLVLFIGSFVLLSWNERDAIRQTGAITEIDKVALADVSTETIDDGNDGKLVHAATKATTSDEIEFRKFGIRENAVRLRWTAEIYQWKENKRERDDRTEYTYSRVWADRPINSNNFRQSGHENTGKQNFTKGKSQAENVSFGAFELSNSLISQIDGEEPYPIPESVALDVRPAGQVSNGTFYTGEPSSPEIGDERVNVFMVGPTHDVTVMAQQTGNTFRAYETKVGIRKELLYMGLMSKDEVIARQRTEAAVRRWMLRGSGFFAMWSGLALILGPIRSLFSFLPFAGRLLGGAIGLITFFIALGLTSVTIAVAWFVVRPLLSTILLTIAAASFYFVYSRKSVDQPTGTPSSVPPPLPNA